MQIRIVAGMLVEPPAFGGMVGKASADGVRNTERPWPLWVLVGHTRGTTKATHALLALSLAKLAPAPLSAGFAGESKGPRTLGSLRRTVKIEIVIALTVMGHPLVRFMRPPAELESPSWHEGPGHESALAEGAHIAGAEVPGIGNRVGRGRTAVETADRGS